MARRSWSASHAPRRPTGTLARSSWRKSLADGDWPAAYRPTANRPAADWPAADWPAADWPAADGPVADGPSADGPVADWRAGHWSVLDRSAGSGLDLSIRPLCREAGRHERCGRDRR